MRPCTTCFGKTVFNCEHAIKAILRRWVGGGLTGEQGSKDADLDGVNLERTLQVGGIEPDQLLYILELKPR